MATESVGTEAEEWAVSDMTIAKPVAFTVRNASTAWPVREILAASGGPLGPGVTRATLELIGSEEALRDSALVSCIIVGEEHDVDAALDRLAAQLLRGWSDHPRIHRGEPRRDAPLLEAGFRELLRCSTGTARDVKRHVFRVATIQAVGTQGDAQELKGQGKRGVVGVPLDLHTRPYLRHLRRTAHKAADDYVKEFLPDRPRRGRLHTHAELDAPLGTDETGRGVTMLETLAVRAEADPLSTVILEEFIESQPERRQEILRLLREDPDLLNTEIGKMIGIPADQVGTHKARIRKDAGKESR